jgi:hypothetical protein
LFDAAILTPSAFPRLLWFQREPPDGIMNLTPKTLLFGFVAGSLSVVVFHQGMVFLLYLMSQTPNFPWNLKGSVGPMGVPVLVNQMFWGGLWGIGFAAIGHLIPIANTALRGAVYGLLGPFLLGGGFLVPLIKQTGPMFWLIGAAFGVGIALIMKVLEKR